MADKHERAIQRYIPPIVRQYPEITAFLLIWGLLFTIGWTVSPEFRAGFRAGVPFL